MTDDDRTGPPKDRRPEDDPPDRDAWLDRELGPQDPEEEGWIEEQPGEEAGDGDDLFGEDGLWESYRDRDVEPAQRPPGVYVVDESLEESDEALDEILDEELDDEVLDKAADRAPENHRPATPPRSQSAAADEPSPRRRLLDSWPLGLIVVAGVALLLLLAGGYGVVKQRSAMEEEIRQLQAALATAVSPEEVDASRQEQRALVQRNEALEQRNRELEAVVGTLQQDTSRLQQTVDDLKGELAEEKAALEREIREEARAGARQEPAAGGQWFVNFGSYAQRGPAARWAQRLQPAQGTVRVTTAQVDGEQLYRVRVTGLVDRDTAERVARELERNHQLSRLWVGRE